MKRSLNFSLSRCATALNPASIAMLPPNRFLRTIAALSILLVGMFHLPAATTSSVTPQAPAPLPFFSEIQAFVTSDQTNPPPSGAVLFIGSSSIRLWKSLPTDFPAHTVINRGFGGSQIID